MNETKCAANYSYTLGNRTSIDCRRYREHASSMSWPTFRHIFYYPLVQHSVILLSSLSRLRDFVCTNQVRIMRDSRTVSSTLQDIDYIIIIITNFALK